MPDNSLAPPNMPWLWQPNGPTSQPNGLGPPMLNYAAPPNPAAPTVGQGVAQTAADVSQALPSWPSVEEQRRLLQPLPGWQGTAVDVAKQWAEGVMMGTTAPGDVPPPGIVAYHGSPHSFDQFDTSKIGTGEGNQAFGHGLYFAEKEGTAQSYRDALATDPRDTLNNYLRGIMNFHAPDDPAITADAIKNGLSNHDDLAMRQLGGNDAAIKDITTILRGYDPNGGSHSQAAMDAYSRLDKVMPQGSPGSMYEVNIGADPEHMLQWDQTVGQHPPALRDKLLDMGYGDTDRGADVYSHLARGKEGDVGASKRLQDAGIPGISYLDQGSRARGEGTKNHVVFDPATIDILRKYGLAGLIAGGGAAAAGTQQQQPSQ